MSDSLVKSVDGLNAENYDLFGLRKFGLAFDIKKILGDESFGHLLYIHESMALSVDRDGHISFSLTDDQGVEVSLETPAVLGDQVEHHIELNYDADAGVMELRVDGDAVASADAAGSSKLEAMIDADAAGEPLADAGDFEVSNSDFVSNETFFTVEAFSEPSSNDDAALASASDEPSANASSASEDDGLASPTVAELDATVVDATVIYVNNSAELKEAVLAATGGEKIMLVNNGEPYSLNIQGAISSAYVDKLSNVTITSADPDNLVTMDDIFLKDVSDLHFDNLIIFSDTKFVDAGWRGDIYVANADNMIFTNLQMSSIAEGTRGLDENVIEGSDAFAAFNVTNLTFSNNTLTNYLDGLNIHECTGSVISDNEITQMQGDGIRLSGIVDTVIEDNYIHNFIGSTHDVQHMDMIQLWAVNETVATENLVIRNNILDAEDGWPTQSIFLNNEDVKQGKTDLVYKDITIENNVIHNAAWHGISVAQVDGLLIKNNSVLYNEKSDVENDSSPPWIEVHDDSTNVTIIDNVATDIVVPAGASLDNNIIINYDQEDSPYYVDKLFVNAGYGGDIGLEALQALPGGVLETSGVGSSFLTFNPTPDNLTALYTIEKVDGQETVFQFDASLTADHNGFLGAADAQFFWDFGDGTTATGLVVEHEFSDYATQEVTLTVTHNTSGESDTAVGYPTTTDPILLDVDFADGKVEDHSSYETAFSNPNDSNIEDGSYHVSDTTELRLGLGQPHMFGLEQFSVSFDMQRSMAAGDDGYIFYLNRSLSLYLNTADTLTLKVTDIDGEVAKIATDSLITDDQWYHIDVSYDSIGGSMEIYVNGELAAQGDTVGATQSEQYWGLIFGTENWSNSADYNIDNIKVTADPFVPSSEENFTIPDEESFMLDTPDLDSFELVYEGTEAADTSVPRTEGDDYYDMKGGDDRLSNTGAGDDWVELGDGNDYVYTADGYDTVFGGTGDDSIRGAELAFGEEGNDILNGDRYSDNMLFGGEGNDILTGYNGNDYLDGGEGIDRLNGGLGDDTLVIDRLDEQVQGASGFDTVFLDDVGDYDIGASGYFGQIERFDMTNSEENTLFINWRDVGGADNDEMFILGDDGDKVVLDATYGNMQDKFTTEQVEIDGQAYTHYQADNGSWLDVDLYVAENVDVDIVM